MSRNPDDDERTYAVGKTGTKAECLAHIDVVWTDPRPLSLRTRQAQETRSP